MQIYLQRETGKEV